MMHPFMTLDDETEILYSDRHTDGSMDVYIEKADDADGFHHMTMVLPAYTIKDSFGFTDEEVERYEKIVRANAHLIR